MTPGRRCPSRVTFHPVVLVVKWDRKNRNIHPVPAVDHLGRMIRRRVETLSEGMGVEWVRQGEDLIWEPKDCPAD